MQYWRWTLQKSKVDLEYKEEETFFRTLFWIQFFLLQISLLPRYISVAYLFCYKCKHQDSLLIYFGLSEDEFTAYIYEQGRLDLKLDEMRLWKINWRKRMLAISKLVHNFCQMIVKSIFLYKLINGYECYQKGVDGLID